MLEFKQWPSLRRFFNQIPGPVLAKLTRLWKTYHLLVGSYTSRLSQLHQLYGPIVQVGPREYSWMCGNSNAEKQELGLIGKTSTRAINTIAPDALVSLIACTHMDRLKRNEHLLHDCDRQFLDLLLLAAQNKEPVDVANVLTRYAFEVMVAMTTEKRAGFLDASPSTERVVRQLSKWRYHSVLFGAFLRYHPAIKSVLNTFHFHSQGQNLLDPVMEVSGQDSNENGNLAFPIREKEARIALVLAGADPTMTLILEVLRTVSQDQELQSQLSEEVRTSSLTKPLSFQSIILDKAQAPLLHAMIQRQIRTQKLSDTGISFVAGAGGARIGNVVVPENETITITSVDSGLGPVDIRSLTDCQQLLAAKLLIQVLQHFKIASLGNGHMSFTVAADEAGRGSASAESPSESDTLLTLSDMEILHENLGPQLTDKLFGWFNPAEASVMPRNITVMVGPITDSGARYNLHQALEHIYGKRILHKTDVDNVVYIAAKGVYLENFTSRNYRGTRNNRAGRSRRNGYVHPWYRDTIKSGEEAIDEEKNAPAPVVRFKETFRLTAPKPDSARLAGPREIMREETTVHDDTGSTNTIDRPGAAFPLHTGTTGLPPSNRTGTGFLPPHRRAALERQRQADEAAASASAQRVSTTLDPVAPIFLTVADKTQPEALKADSMQTATTSSETASPDATADALNFFAATTPATSPHDVINLFTGEPATADDFADRWTTEPVLSGDISSSEQEPPTAQASSTSPQPSLVRSHGSMDMSGAPEPSSPAAASPSPPSPPPSSPLGPLAPDFIPGSDSS